MNFGEYARKTRQFKATQLGWLALAVTLALTGILAARPAHAETNVACGLSVEIMAAPFAVVDSNKHDEEGPRVATLGARITNTGGTPLSDVTAYIGGGEHPGEFPEGRDGKLELMKDADATRALGELAPGGSVTVYWQVTYPTEKEAGYAYTVYARDAGDACTAEASGEITTQKSISARANKLQPVGGLITMSPSNVTPGGLVTLKIQGFDLGTIGQGPKPLEPEDAWLQPIGNEDFDPTCLRLVKTEVLLSSISAQPFVDQLYFSKIGHYRNSASDYVTYTFLALDECSTRVQPYQQAASGTQEKYNDDFTGSRRSIKVRNAGPTPTPDDSEVQSGADGGLESGPLAGDPSLFVGGIGLDEEVNAAALQQAQVLHKARLLEAMSLKPEDLLPATGPAGTTPQEAVPVDVLAFTEAPDAKAVDYVDANGDVQAVVMAINSVNGPYEHDYGVCNRFKSYAFDTVEPMLVDVSSIGLPGSYWFWHSVSTRDVTVREETVTFHIFVDEAGKTFHIDSRWIQDEYPDSFDFAFDYVFNMQVWSTDIAQTTALLLGIFNKMQELDGGAWSLSFHNTSPPVAPQVFIVSTSYHADNVDVVLQNKADAPQPVDISGIWRSQVDRTTDNPFGYTLTLDPGETTISLPFPGLQVVTLLTANNGFRDKIFTGGGLWFDFANTETAETSLAFPQCRALEEIDTTDLMLAGCVDMAGANLTGGEQAGLGRTLNPNGRPVDVSPYRALRFWARGDGAPMRVILESAGITDGDYYQAVFTPTGEWSQYIIPLDAFGQRGFGEAKPFTGTDVKAVIWTNVDGGRPDLAFSVDQVSFTNRGLIAAESHAASTADTGAHTIAVQAENGAGVAAMTLRYSVDDGATFADLPMTGDAGGRFSAAIPGQPLGSDILFYVEAQHSNGYASTSPLDAPASLYRYRVDDRTDLLVDDFAGENLRNRNGGTGGLFNNPDAGGRLQVYRQDYTLVLDYDVTTAGQYAGYFSRLNGLDGSGFNTIDLLVRGEQGGEQLLVGLRDENGRESKVSVGDVMPRGVTSRWQWVQIPVHAFDAALDRSKLTNISLSFQEGYGAPQGRVYIGEMRLSGLVGATVIDRFDDANDRINGQGLGYIIDAPGATLTTQYVADAQTVGGHALQLTYNVGPGGYAVWRSPLRSVAAPDGTLVLWVKGGPQAVAPNLYLGDGANRARVALADHMAFDGRWQRVAVPLSVFAAQGVDVNHLTGLEIVFEFATGAGTVSVDNIAIERAGPMQVSRRVLHMNDRDQRYVALHTSGGAWQSTSVNGWLSTSAAGDGPSAVTVFTDSAQLAPGEYTGELVFRGADNVEEHMTVYLSVSPDAPATHRVFVPMLNR